MGSVRESTFEVARQHGMTTWFGNPGSTEIPLLADLPDDMRYVHGLGFGIPAAIGIRMARPDRPDRPVIGVIGDGSSIYCVQALWTAAHYGADVVIFAMGNARYLVMDRQTARRGKIPWPSLERVRVDRRAGALGVPSVRVSAVEHLVKVLDEVMPGLRERDQPLVVDVRLDAAQ